MFYLILSGPGDCDREASNLSRDDAFQRLATNLPLRLSGRKDHKIAEPADCMKSRMISLRLLLPIV